MASSLSQTSERSRVPLPTTNGQRAADASGPGASRVARSFDATSRILLEDVHAVIAGGAAANVTVSSGI